jgi:hypothetical protein
MKFGFDIFADSPSDSSNIKIKITLIQCQIYVKLYFSNCMEMFSKKGQKNQGRVVISYSRSDVIRN